MPEPTTLARSYLSPKAWERLDGVFQSMDTDSSGSISADEFKQACSQLSISISEDELRDFWKSDISGDGELDFNEFCDFYVKRLQKVFQEIDTDGSGAINTQELKGAFERLGFQVRWNRSMCIFTVE